MSHGWKWAAVLLLSATGCSKSDPDTLATIGRKVADRTQVLTDNLQQTWTQFSAKMVLENRVRARLHWEKSLSESSIEVHATDKAVELKGNLTSQDQIRRAVELAESTVGVEKVVSSLHVERP